MCSARTPRQNVGCTVQDGEFTKPTRESVTLAVHATSNSRGPLPYIDAFACPAAYQGQPPPSMILVVSVPSTATLLKLAPQSTAVGPCGQSSVGHRGSWAMGSAGVTALKMDAFAPSSSVRLETSAIEAWTLKVL